MIEGVRFVGGNGEMESLQREIMVRDNPGDGDSSQSIVLQCGAPGDVEQGEEMVCGETRGSGMSLSAALQAYCGGLQSEKLVERLGMQRLARGLAAEFEKWGDLEKVWRVAKNACETGVGLAGDSEDLVRARVPNQSVGDLTKDCFHSERGYRRSVGKGRRQTRKSFMPRRFGVDDSRDEVQRDSTKKKKEEIKDSYPVSGYNWALSSCSDATDSETEQCTRKKSNVKRKRKENDATETPQMRREMFCKRTSAQRSSSLRDQEESVDCDEELTGMQALLEMQLKASESSEAGMNQCMEMVMDMLFVYTGHAEKRVSHLEELAQPNEQVLDRISDKLEKVMEGLTTVNENLTVLSACLFSNLGPQRPH